MQTASTVIKARYFAKKRAAAPDTLCACGCGASLKSVDAYGRAQSFLSGHNGRKFTGQDATRWAVQKRWAKANPDKIRDGKRNYYRRRKLRAMEVLGNACHFCGVAYDGQNAPIFEFRHTDPAEKDIGITRIVSNLTWESVLVELRKCVLTCANCHNKHHGGEW